MAGFFENLMSAANKIEKAANDIKKIRDKIENLNQTSEEKAEKSGEFNVSSMPISYTDKLTEEYYNFEFDGTKYRYKLYKPTSFFISHSNFGALEICDVYLFSPNGEEINDVMNVDTDNTAHITFGDWEYNPGQENREEILKAKNYGISGCKIDKINRGNIVYKVYGENSSRYIESYFLITKGKGEDENELHENHFRITLFIAKNGFSPEQVNEMLNEFHSIIDTLEAESI